MLGWDDPWRMATGGGRLLAARNVAWSVAVVGVLAIAEPPNARGQSPRIAEPGQQASDPAVARLFREIQAWEGEPTRMARASPGRRPGRGAGDAPAGHRARQYLERPARDRTGPGGDGGPGRVPQDAAHGPESRPHPGTGGLGGSGDPRGGRDRAAPAGGQEGRRGDVRAGVAVRREARTGPEEDRGRGDHQGTGDGRGSRRGAEGRGRDLRSARAARCPGPRPDQGRQARRGGPGADPPDDRRREDASGRGQGLRRRPVEAEDPEDGRPVRAGVGPGRGQRSGRGREDLAASPADRRGRERRGRARTATSGGSRGSW